MKALGYQLPRNSKTPAHITDDHLKPIVAKVTISVASQSWISLPLISCYYFWTDVCIMSLMAFCISNLGWFVDSFWYTCRLYFQHPMCVPLRSVEHPWEQIMILSIKNSDITKRSRQCLMGHEHFHWALAEVWVTWLLGRWQMPVVSTEIPR